MGGPEGRRDDVLKGKSSGFISHFLSSPHGPPYTGSGWKGPPCDPTEPNRVNDEILTALEVATLLKVVDKAVYTMVQKGEISVFKIRSQWRFTCQQRLEAQ